MKTYRKLTSATVTAVLLSHDCKIVTLEGTMQGKKGDYRLTGDCGEQWVVRKDIFEKTYEEVN